MWSVILFRKNSQQKVGRPSVSLRNFRSMLISSGFGKGILIYFYIKE
jgi:hypothetical protein